MSTDGWEAFHVTLENLGLLASKLGFDQVTFRAIGARSIVVCQPDRRSAVLEVPPAGERLSADVLQAALRSAT